MEITPELVLERVRAAGGHLVVEDLDAASLALWQHASKVAQLRLLRAGSERLRRYSDPGKLSLTLEQVDGDEDDQDGDNDPVLRWTPPSPILPRTEEFIGREVPVPSTVRKPHPLVEQLVEAVDWPERRMRAQYGEWRVPSQRRPLQKMRRIWQAIIDEAEFRGYSTRVRHDRRDSYDRGQLIVEIGRDEFPLALYGDQKSRLHLQITERHPSRRRGYDCWNDSDEQPLHRLLGEIFTHIERWADLLVAERERQYQREEEARRRRARAVAEAKQRFAEDHRRTVIAQRIAEVGFVDDTRTYSAALLEAADGLEPGHGDQVRAWARWAAEHADRVDPRRTLAGAPTVPEPTREQLEPYLPAGIRYYL